MTTKMYGPFGNNILWACQYFPIRPTSLFSFSYYCVDASSLRRKYLQFICSTKCLRENSSHNLAASSLTHSKANPLGCRRLRNSMAIVSSVAVSKFPTSEIFGIGLGGLGSSNIRPLHPAKMVVKPLVIQARANTRTENAKIRNRRIRKKFNGTATKPRLSVFCSDKQLYAMLVDDQNKKILFYGSTLQKSIREDACTTAEAAKRVGEELVKTCEDLDIDEISHYDRNGLARGERMQAFEIAIGRHGFLPR